MVRRRDPNTGRFVSAPAIAKPKRGARRQTYDVLQHRGTYTALGYRAVTVASKEGRGTVGGSGAVHTQYHRPALLNQSRDFVRNNGIYRGIIERAAGYIIGGGFGLQARTTSKRWNREAERLWREYWRKPGVKQLLSGQQTERMVCTELLKCGDTGVVKLGKPRAGLIQLIEAEQITSKTYRDGIKKDEWGMPVKFFVTAYGARGQLANERARQIEPEFFLFMTTPERPTGVRSVPPCQASFPMLHRINDVCDSEAIAWQLLARLALSITREAGPQIGQEESTEDPGASGDELAVRITELAYALVFHGESGDEIKGIERNIPGRNFQESVVMFLRLLGLPLGMPLEIVLLDWTKSNYSQSRAVLEQAYQTFQDWQNIIAGGFNRPVYEWKVGQWVRSGLLAERADALQHDWIKPTFPWIDQLKEAQAQGAKLDRGFTTHAIVCKSLNLERENVVEARQAEVLDAIKRAQKLEKQTGVEVPWEIFAGLRPPGVKGGRRAGDTPAGGDTPTGPREPSEDEQAERAEGEEEE